MCFRQKRNFRSRAFRFIFSSWLPTSAPSIFHRRFKVAYVRRILHYENYAGVYKPITSRQGALVDASALIPSSAPSSAETQKPRRAYFDRSTDRPIEVAAAAAAAEHDYSELMLARGS